MRCRSKDPHAVHWLECTGRGSHLGDNIKRKVPLARRGQEHGKFENGSGKEKSSRNEVISGGIVTQVPNVYHLERQQPPSVEKIGALAAAAQSCGERAGCEVWCVRCEV